MNFSRFFFLAIFGQFFGRLSKLIFKHCVLYVATEFSNGPRSRLLQCRISCAGRSRATMDWCSSVHFFQMILPSPKLFYAERGKTWSRFSSLHKLNDCFSNPHYSTERWRGRSPGWFFLCLKEQKAKFFGRNSPESYSRFCFYHWESAFISKSSI